MAELDTHLGDNSVNYMAYLDEFERNFQETIQEFFCSHSMKCLVLETKDTKSGVWRIRNVLERDEEALNEKYKGTTNQTFLMWNNLVGEIASSRLVPKFSNLVVLDMSEEELENESLYVIGKIMGRLNLAVWRKVIFVTAQVESMDIFLQGMAPGAYLKINEFEDKLSSQIDIAEQNHLIRAAAVGDAKSVDELLKTDESDECIKNTALHLAIERGYKDIVLLLIQSGVNLNSSLKGNIPLDLASYRGFEDIVVALVENGADVDLSTSFSSTPLIQAARQGYYNIVKTLIEYGADINIQNDNGSSALHLAAENGHYIIVYELLKYGADQNSKDHNDYMPLHYAAAYGYSDIVKALLGMNGFIDAQTREGKSPLDLAREYGHDEIVQQLNDHLEERTVLRQAINIIKRRSSMIIE